MKTSNSFIDKAKAYYIAFAFFLSLQVIAFGYGLTTTRIVPILLIMFIAFNSTKYKHVSRLVYLPLTAAIVLAFSSYFSFILFGGQIWPVVSWFFLGLLCTLLAISTQIMRQVDNGENFLKGLIFLLFIHVCFIAYNLSSAGILLASGPQIRSYFIVESLESSYIPDPNRLMNTIFVYSAICFGSLYMGLLQPFKWKLISLYITVFSIFFIIMTGSRQNFIAMILFAALIYFKHKKSRTDNLSYLSGKHIRFAGIVFALLVIMTLLIKMDYLDMVWLEDRFKNTLVVKKMVHSDETRYYAIFDAWRMSLENGGFGVGPGCYTEKYMEQGSVHNGYLYLMAETGIIGGGMAILITFIVIYKIRKRTCYNSGRISIIFWLIFLIVSLWLTNLKLLFREPIYWSILGLYIGFSVYPKRIPFTCLKIPGRFR